MPPKKNKKISLNEFLGDTGSASWADEMDSLPNAPAVRPEGDTGGRDRFGRDDFLSSRPDRGPAQPREDVPLPTAPPYTAFIGNLSFDLTEADLEDFFGSAKTIKIIKDREDKPKGFGYIEFEELDGLKDALSKHGQSFSGRTIRVSVAEPPKERGGFGSGQEDSGKFDDPWRRGGPLPDLPGRESRKRFDGPPREDRLPSVSEGPSDWRSSMPSRAAEVTPPGSIRRKGPGFVPEPGAADTADSWTKGSKFRPSAPEDDKGGRFGARRGDIPPRERDGPTEESDWRSRSARPVGHSSTSPNSSTPPTPQMGRRKLELLPRTGGPSGGPSPLSSPKIGPTPTASANSTKSNPFGAAKPVDVSNKDKEVAEKLEKEREATKERLTMSRTNSRTGVDRPTTRRIDTPPTSAGAVPSSPRQSTSERVISPKSVSANANVRPAISFASVASKKDGSAADQEQAADDVDDVADKVAETSL